MWRSVRSTFQKEFILSRGDPHLLEVLDLPAQKGGRGEAGPSPGTEKRSDVSTQTAKKKGLKVIGSQTEKQGRTSWTHDHQLKGGAGHSENCAKSMNCGKTVSRLRVRICSRKKKGGLCQSFKKGQVFSEKKVAGVWTPAKKSRHGPRRFQKKSVALCQKKR